ncbi:CDP-glucose 4,6-dehydratase [Leptospira sp. 201903071]|uniref:CDP-glucose 4,6-dehydratase n=1 Tax=Leptospira ainazelensis TaxID=2810034 RepID=UPI0019622AF0|nr:CDP-glucose 4,6-dehydratase [Leptospira ainazelensis]MBM9501971.1 CDP-glucose 4,6-dehydratase [Leptospira ainazelensis]
MDSLIRFFKGKRILITGHTGFKGSWLTFILKQAGADVAGYALPPITEVSHFDLLGLKKEILHTEGDIRDFSKLNDLFQSFKPEIVFHLAAQALVRESYSDPRTTFETNVMGSVNLLQAVHLSDSIKTLVYITSDKCYENVEWVWGYREIDQLGGHDPYSASKASAELVFSSYLRSFFLKKKDFGAASARAGNVIGGGDWSVDRIIPDCIRAVTTNGKIILRNPNATRPWQHVLEPLSGYLTLAKNLSEDPKKFSSAWNFGPSTQKVRTVYEVSRSIIDSLGKGEIIIDQSHDKVHEAHLLQLNCDKAHQYLNWYPRWSVDQTLEATASWYKHYMEGGDIREKTKEQIEKYFSND